MFADFNLVISASTGGQETGKRFPLSAMSSFGGRANSSFVFDNNAEPMTTDLVLASGNDPAPGLREAVGKRLFGMLHTTDVLDLWLDTKARAAAEGMSVRFRLSIDDSALAVVPWEILHDGTDFLATSADKPFSRFLPVGIAPYYSPPEILRLLIIVQDPGGEFAITSEEIESLESALTELRPSVTFKRLHNASIAEIQAELQTNYQMVHYLGHGDVSRLFFASEKKMFALDDAAFAQLFVGRRSLRLVVLNACSSADSGGGGLFSGVGPALVAKRIPAIVAMQYRFVRLETAGQFSKALYRSIANGLPIDLAVNEARQLISAGPLLATREWSTPVLYMSTPVGRILDMQGSNVTQDAWNSIRKRANHSAQIGASLNEVAQTVREFVTYQHEILTKDVREGFELLGYLHHLKSIFSQTGGRIAKLNATSPELPQLWSQFESDWGLLEANVLPSMKSYLSNRPDHHFYSAGAEILSKGDLIRSALQRVELLDIVDRCREFETLVVNTDASIHQQINDAIKELISASDRTLAKLS